METSLLTFLLEKSSQLAEKILQQLYLVILAVLFAILIGVPLGIWATQTQFAKKIILSISSILQTIPSLALLAFLIPFLGIGIKPALLALIIYALLPIIANTITGIESISKAYVEAADAVAFNKWQKLTLIKLPLALPSIIGGIRIASAMCVGIATLAAFVGAGGLGDFIFQGISLNDNRLVLLGAIPAAGLALLLDFIIAKIEKRISQPHSYPSHKRTRKLISIIATIILSLVIMFAFSYYYFFASPKNNVIRIATKNFTEQYILGYLMTDMITAKTNLKVDKKFNLGPTDICQAAMLKSDIDSYPEYTGTAAAVILKQKFAGNTQQIYEQIKASYLKKYNILWLQPFGFNNTQAIAVREDFANRYHLKTISDLKNIAIKLTFGAPAEFMERADAFPGLKKIYGLQFGSVRQMDPGLMYKAIANGKVDVIMAFSTDGRIAAYHLKLLQDDKRLFPTYFAAPLIRVDFAKIHPEVISALQSLASLIDDKTMQRLNYQVDVEKQDPEDVAKNFLISKGLLQRKPST